MSEDKKKDGVLSIDDVDSLLGGDDSYEYDEKASAEKTYLKYKLGGLEGFSYDEVDHLLYVVGEHFPEDNDTLKFDIDLQFGLKKNFKSALESFNDGLSDLLSSVTQDKVTVSMEEPLKTTGTAYFENVFLPSAIFHIPSDLYKFGFYLVIEARLVSALLNAQMGGVERPFSKIAGKDLTRIDQLFIKNMAKDVLEIFKKETKNSFKLDGPVILNEPIKSYAKDKLDDRDKINIYKISVSGKHFSGEMDLIFPHPDHVFVLELNDENPQTLATMLQRADLKLAGLIFKNLNDSVKAEVLYRILSEKGKVGSYGDVALKTVYKLKEQDFLPKERVSDLLKGMDEDSKKMVISRLLEKEPDLEIS